MQHRLRGDWLGMNHASSRLVVQLIRRRRSNGAELLDRLQTGNRTRLIRDQPTANPRPYT
jgi:hypothetical protein